jgi:hypothetical protein
MALKIVQHTIYGSTLLLHVELPGPPFAMQTSCIHIHPSVSNAHTTLTIRLCLSHVLYSTSCFVSSLLLTQQQAQQGCAVSAAATPAGNGVTYTAAVAAAPKYSESKTRLLQPHGCESGV